MIPHFVSGKNEKFYRRRSCTAVAIFFALMKIEDIFSLNVATFGDLVIGVRQLALKYLTVNINFFPVPHFQPLR